MILFLDIICPKPKFVLIDNNNVVETLHILDNNYDKISDNIINKFLILLKKHNFLDKINYLVVCTGPGSYTSLRVGISFMYGLSYSNKIPIYGLTCSDLLSQFVLKKNFYNAVIFICSLNNQNYLLLPKNHTKNYYKIIQVNEESSFNDVNLNEYSKCIANYNLPNFLRKKIDSSFKNIEYINFEDRLKESFIINFNKNDIIQPIYIATNKLFD